MKLLSLIFVLHIYFFKTIAKLFIKRCSCWIGHVCEISVEQISVLFDMDNLTNIKLETVVPA